MNCVQTGRRNEHLKNLILTGSPRRDGNTAQMVKQLMAELSALGEESLRVDLADKRIEPCVDCLHCQRDHAVFGCPIRDDAQTLFDLILSSNRLILATPIYSWFCTPPMKSLLDRLVRGMNKFYGEIRGPALWQGRELALLVSCGYPPEKGADLFVEGMRRYAKHSGLRYAGELCLHDPARNGTFWTGAAAKAVRDFARVLAGRA